MIDTQLARAARNVEERFEVLGVGAKQISLERWVASPTTVPEWIPVLLASYRLSGGVLEYRDRSEPFVRLFQFLEPEHYAMEFQEGSRTKPLLSWGYFPIGYESDGSLWILQGHSQS